MSNIKQGDGLAGMTKKIWFTSAFALICLVMLAAPAKGVVVNFDDLPVWHDLTGTAYAGLTWEQGSPGLHGDAGFWCSVSGGYTYPNSLPNVVDNGAGCSLIGIGFPSAADVAGAYLAVIGNITEWGTEGVRVHGYLAGQLVGSTDWFTNITATPTWFDMSLLRSVDRIVFESLPQSENAGFFSMDDLTFTYIPEPAGLAAIGFAGTCLLARRRRVEKRRG